MEKDYQKFIYDEEYLLRLLSYPSCIRKDKALTPVAFEPVIDRDQYVSFVRIYFFNSIKEAIERGSNIKNWKTSNDYFCGAAKLNAGAIRKVSPDHLDLRSKYTVKNESHAGLYFVNGGCNYIFTKGEPAPGWILDIRYSLCKISEVILK